MKKKCAGCRALSRDDNGLYCRLGHEIDYYRVNEYFECPKPKEECPKPLTYVALFAAERRKEQMSDGVK